MSGRSYKKKKKTTQRRGGGKKEKKRIGKQPRKTKKKRKRRGGNPPQGIKGRRLGKQEKERRVPVSRHPRERQAPSSRRGLKGGNTFQDTRSGEGYLAHFKKKETNGLKGKKRIEKAKKKDPCGNTKKKFL